MNHERNEHHSDPVDAAVQGLLREDTPAGPAPEVQATLLKRIEQEAQTVSPNHPLSFFLRRPTVMKIAAVIALLAAAGFFAVTATTPTKAIAFEDVARQIMKIESASYELSTTVQYPDGRSIELAKNKVTVQMPDKMRIEMPGGMVSIFDFSEDKMLMLMADNKVAMLIPGISSEFGTNQKETQFLGDIQDHLRQAEHGDKLDGVKYEDLGEKQIDDSKAIGFRVLTQDASKDKEQAEADADQPTNTFDVWADAESGVIVLLEFKTPGADGGTVIYTYKNFVYNQKLDPKLLSLEAPEGYMLVNPEAGALADLPESETNKGTLRLLIENISLYATENEGLFPATLQSQVIKDHLTEQWKSENPGKPVYQDKDQSQYTDPMLRKVHDLIDDAFAFVRKLEADGVDYEYAGKGVKFGDSKAPILWFKPNGADTYTVVYGDMKIKQADEAPATP